jgi:methylthioribose-1-phosphate isomerase
MYTIRWYRGAVRIIDQTLLPGKLKYLDLRTVPALCEAIKTLRVRGAPALGAAAALGVYLGVKDFRGSTAAFLRRMDEVARTIGASRPTARNLFWGLERMRQAAAAQRVAPLAKLKGALLQCALDAVEEDRRVCRRMGEHGQALLRDHATVLTVCNAGALATIDYGTALGVLYAAKARGKRLKVFACETRPLLQGARLTTWELMRARIPVTLICDNMAASLMGKGGIDAVITGADRIAANGDTANKVGTYMLAVLAKYHGIPFYVAAPRSTFDPRLEDGTRIPIEERSPQEVTTLHFVKPSAPRGVRVYNPAFDVTAHGLITAFITEDGVIRPPFKKYISTL